MKVQVINYEEESTSGEYTYSTISSPRALDEFSLNIIDLGNEQIWYSDEDHRAIRIIDDINSLHVMISEAKTKVLVSFPQDIMFHTFSGRSYQKAQYKTNRIKNMLTFIQKDILYLLFPDCAQPSLIYENTVSVIGDYEYNAAFSIGPYFSDKCVSSKGGDKGTLVRLSEKIYFTTLDFLSSRELRDNLVERIFSDEPLPEKPGWLDSVSFWDDDIQKESVCKGKSLIEQGKSLIDNANKKLSENEWYKSILYTNGDELVKVVFAILEQLLSCDLSDFKDVKKEDFLIRKGTYTLIGEIKGVSTNVKSEHISQLDWHYHGYLDKLAEVNQKENVRQVLVINPFRNKPVSEREQIHSIQINLAKRNEALIIETITLLRLFEKYKRGEISSDDCEVLFTTKTGILSITDIKKMP